MSIAPAEHCSHTTIGRFQPILRRLFSHGVIGGMGEGEKGRRGYRIVCVIEISLTRSIAREYLGVIFCCTCIEVPEHNLTRGVHIPTSPKSGEATDEPPNIAICVLVHRK